MAGKRAIRIAYDKDKGVIKVRFGELKVEEYVGKNIKDKKLLNELVRWIVFKNFRFESEAHDKEDVLVRIKRISQIDSINARFN